MKHLLKYSFTGLLFALLAAGCATTPETDQAAADTAAGTEQATGVETGTLSQDEMLAADPLNDPSSPLAIRTIYFDFDKSDIRPEFLDVLTVHAEYLVANPTVRVRLEGHTDERGSREYNIALGDRRAQAVRRILLFQGVANDQVEIVSYGEERPTAFGQTEEAYAQNRRVEIVYIQ